ncbi:hypothetical protein [Phycisphaera mikurensis]|uniref:Uncharacterized protein n=1 Tax=Phycisphaera mikurensis (strain NBRC 102666 / KCTC 22515 / FYK2301M01) TaxID=1142394 RepID=I0IE61_PHYMF|nr:hypothetical protein [Phycisphaera mikurensis]MBB6441353.1 endonuclease III [Phycisphaera mikurensis]BAM03549.1 hypothetical protein PSMK_13900 [Phycisphaera mikurensis NBRC 102666]
MARKTSTGDADRFAKLLAEKTKRAAEADRLEPPPVGDPVSQLVLSMLTFNTVTERAEAAFTRLLDELVDLHELRVSHPYELVSIVGDGYPGIEDRIVRIREALFAIYDAENDLNLQSIAGKGKKEQRAYLDGLESVPPYAAAQVSLLCYGAHAMPVDERLLAALVAEGVFEAEETCAAAEGFLLRQVKAGEAMEAHLALQAWADTLPDELPERVRLTRKIDPEARDAGDPKPPAKLGPEPEPPARSDVARPAAGHPLVEARRIKAIAAAEASAKAAGSRPNRKRARAKAKPVAKSG